MAQYALRQHGIIVAEVSGPDAAAVREINHYAAQYVRDGAVEIIGPVDDDVCMVCYIRAGARLECDCDWNN